MLVFKIMDYQMDENPQEKINTDNKNNNSENNNSQSDDENTHTGSEIDYEDLDIPEQIIFMLKQFKNACEYDANVILYDIFFDLQCKQKQYNLIVDNNKATIKRINHKLSKLYDHYTDEHTIIDHINKTLFDPTKTRNENLFKTIDNILQNKLSEYEKNELSLDIMSELEIDFNTMYVGAKYSNITFDIWKKYHEMLSVNLFLSYAITNAYINKISQTIKKQIETTKISQQMCVDIICANPDIKFIHFSKAADYLHNMVRNYFVPNDNYILMLDKDTHKRTICGYKITDISKIYGSTGKIIIKYINKLESQEDLDMLCFQNKIINTHTTINLASLFDIKKDCESKHINVKFYHNTTIDDLIKISSLIKRNVWDKYVGDNLKKSKCWCCRLNEINVNDFYCENIDVVHNIEGDDESLKQEYTFDKINELRQICKKCSSIIMCFGKPMNDFIKLNDFHK